MAYNYSANGLDAGSDTPGQELNLSYLHASDKYMSSTAASIASSDDRKAIVPEWPSRSLSRSSSNSGVSMTANRDGVEGNVKKQYKDELEFGSDKSMEDELDDTDDNSSLVGVKSVTSTEHRRKVLNINDSSIRKKLAITSSPLSKGVSYSDSSSNNTTKFQRNVSNLSVSSSMHNNSSASLTKFVPNEPPITLSEKINLLRPGSTAKRLNPLVLSPKESHLHNNSLSNINSMMISNNIIVDDKDLKKSPLMPVRKKSGLLGEKLDANYDHINGGGYPQITFNRLSHMTSFSTVGGMSDFEDDESSLSNYR